MVDNLSVLQLDMIAAGQCLSFSVCLFALNLFLICFLKTANVFPLSSQLTIKIKDLYIVFTSIFLIFFRTGKIACKPSNGASFSLSFDRACVKEKLVVVLSSVSRRRL